MNIKAGTILISAPSLDDLNFDKVVIFIAEYNAKGALGFVVNKLFPRRFNDLVEFRDSIDFPLYEGGPVERESLYFLHCRPDTIADGMPVIDSVYYGGNFTQAVTHMNATTIRQNDIKLFVGYCGWDENELEEEIKEGSWLITNAATDIVFSDDIKLLWETLYQKSLE